MDVTKLKTTLEQKEQEVRILRQIAQTISGLDLDKILECTAEIATQLAKADACSVYLLDNKKEELILYALKSSYPDAFTPRLRIEGDVADWVRKKGGPIAISRNAIPDPWFKFFYPSYQDKFKSFLSIPIISKDEMIGLINILHRRVYRHKGPEITLLCDFAGQIGNAVESARFYQEAKEKAKQLEVLSEISHMIVSNRYLKEILQLIVTMTAQVMNSKICSIMLLDDKRQELFIGATQSLSKEYINKPNVKIGQSISGLAVKKKKPITVTDVTKEPGYMYPQIAQKEGIVSMLSVPMMIRDRVIGVINSYTSYEHRFTNEEIRILQVIANQAAVAIENTHLMQEILRAKEALEMRKIVEKAKGILMEQFDISEDEAYVMIRKKSMDLRKTMREVAESIILFSEMRREI
ncbi:MAG TPA: GAF domain-containing protein [Syntrophaceae bacterium]|nr:GAF domain-containing protein [Syntrophaceae bacterium]